jgi:hypothetical protein
MGSVIEPRPGRFTPGKDPIPIVQEAGWALRPVWTGMEKLAPTGIRSPNRPARSELLSNPSWRFKNIKMIAIEWKAQDYLWRFMSSRTRCCVIGREAPNVSKESSSATILQNVEYHSPCNTRPHPNKPCTFSNTAVRTWNLGFAIYVNLLSTHRTFHCMHKILYRCKLSRFFLYGSTALYGPGPGPPRFVEVSRSHTL